MRSSHSSTASGSIPVSLRFWSTVRSGTSAGSWNTVASPALVASRGRFRVASAPLTVTVPLSAAITPERILTIVLFPAPLAPSRAWISPGSTVRSTERRATTGP